MKAYLMRRVIGLALNMVLVSMFVFTMLHLVRETIQQPILGVNATPQNVTAFRERNGLTGSLFNQYVRWSTGVLTGNFGKSLRGGTQVTDDSRRGCR